MTTVVQKREIVLNKFEQKLLAILRREGKVKSKTLFETLLKEVTEEGQELSRPYFTNLLEHLTGEGVIEYESIGRERHYKVCEDAEVMEGIARVSQPILTDLSQKLKQTLSMFNIKGRLHRNIVTMFSENPGYQNPQGLNWLLNAFKIEPNTARIISDHLFAAYRAQFTPTIGHPPPGGPFQPYQQPYYGGYGGQPMATQPQVTHTPSGMQIIQYPVPSPQGSAPMVIVSPPTQPQPGSGVTHRVTERLAERTVYRYKLDEKGETVLGEDGKPVITEVVKEPIILGGGGSGQQMSPKEIVDMTIQIAKAVRPEEGTKAPPVDEEKILLKTKEAVTKEIKPEIDTLKGHIGGVNSSVDKLATEIRQYFTVQSAVKPYEDRIKEYEKTRGLSDSQFRLQTQEKLIKHLADRLDTIPATIRQFMGQQYVQTLAIMEQQYGMEPGTLIIPYITQQTGRTPGTSAPVPKTSISERKEMLEKMRAKTTA